MQVVVPKQRREMKDSYSRFIGVFNGANVPLKTLEDCAESQKILFGTNMIVNRVAGDIIYMHPIEVDMENISKFVKYEAGSEEGVSLLLLNAFCANLDMGDLNNFIEELDIGYLSAESSVSEEELDEVVALVKSRSNNAIVVSDDIYTHEAVENIAAILANISKHTGISVVALKPKFPTVSDNSAIFTKITEPDYLPSFDGVVVYNLFGECNDLVGSEQFALAAKIQDGTIVHFDIDGVSFKKIFKLDNNLKGTIAINPTDNLEVLSSYRFKRIKINKVGSENE